MIFARKPGAGKRRTRIAGSLNIAGHCVTLRAETILRHHWCPDLYLYISGEEVVEGSVLRYKQGMDTKGGTPCRS